MGYEHEKFVLSLLTSLAIKKENKGYYKISDEVEDVYAKAKKWDNYMSQIEEYAQGLRDIDDMIRKKNK